MSGVSAEVSTKSVADLAEEYDRIASNLKESNSVSGVVKNPNKTVKKVTKKVIKKSSSGNVTPVSPASDTVNIPITDNDREDAIVADMDFSKVTSFVNAQKQSQTQVQASVKPPVVPFNNIIQVEPVTSDVPVVSSVSMVEYLAAKKKSYEESDRRASLQASRESQLRVVSEQEAAIRKEKEADAIRRASLAQKEAQRLRNEAILLQSKAETKVDNSAPQPQHFIIPSISGLIRQQTDISSPETLVRSPRSESSTPRFSPVRMTTSGTVSSPPRKSISNNVPALAINDLSKESVNVSHQNKSPENPYNASNRNTGSWCETVRESRESRLSSRASLAASQPLSSPSGRGGMAVTSRVVIVVGGCGSHISNNSLSLRLVSAAEHRLDFPSSVILFSGSESDVQYLSEQAEHAHGLPLHHILMVANAANTIEAAVFSLQLLKAYHETKAPLVTLAAAFSPRKSGTSQQFDRLSISSAKAIEGAVDAPMKQSSSFNAIRNILVTVVSSSPFMSRTQTVFNRVYTGRSDSTIGNGYTLEFIDADPHNGMDISVSSLEVAMEREYEERSVPSLVSWYEELQKDLSGERLLEAGRSGLVTDIEAWCKVHPGRSVDIGRTRRVSNVPSLGASFSSFGGNGIVLLGCTALHLAAYFGHITVTRLILENGADPNARDGGGATPLHFAYLKNHSRLAEILLEFGASESVPGTSVGSLWKGEKTPADVKVLETRGRSRCPWQIDVDTVSAHSSLDAVASEVSTSPKSPSKFLIPSYSTDACKVGRVVVVLGFLLELKAPHRVSAPLASRLQCAARLLEMARLNGNSALIAVGCNDYSDSASNRLPTADRMAEYLTSSSCCDPPVRSQSIICERRAQTAVDAAFYVKMILSSMSADEVVIVCNNFDLQRIEEAFNTVFGRKGKGGKGAGFSSSSFSLFFKAADDGLIACDSSNTNGEFDINTLERRELILCADLTEQIARRASLDVAIVANDDRAVRVWRDTHPYTNLDNPSILSSARDRTKPSSCGVMSTEEDEKESSSLHWAANNSCLSAAEALLANPSPLEGPTPMPGPDEEGIPGPLNPNVTNANGATALHFAARRGHVGIVTLLLSHGADATKRAESPLWRGNLTPLEICEAMIATGLKGSYSLVRDVLGGDNGSLFSKSASVSELLLDPQLAESVLSPRLSSPRHMSNSLSARTKQREMIVQSNSIGRQHLWIAARRGSIAEVKNLLDSLGHSLVHQSADAFGNTALHHASLQGFTGVVAYLLRVGADPNYRNSTGATALHMAAVKGHTEVCMLLCSHGGNATLVGAGMFWIGTKSVFEVAKNDEVRVSLSQLHVSGAPALPSKLDY